MKKCNAEDCWYCTVHPRRVEDLNWLPDSVMKHNKTDYLAFKDVFGKPTTDADRPSLKEKPAPTESDKENKSVLVAGMLIPGPSIIFSELYL